MVFAVRTTCCTACGTSNIARVPSSTAAVQQCSYWYVWYVTSTAVRTYAVVGQVCEALFWFVAHGMCRRSERNSKVRTCTFMMVVRCKAAAVGVLVFIFHSAENKSQ